MLTAAKVTAVSVNQKIKASSPAHLRIAFYVVLILCPSCLDCLFTVYIQMQFLSQDWKTSQLTSYYF